MILLNVEFQEEYKRLDALCQDLFSSSNGVTEYLREMEFTSQTYCRLVLDWNEYYQRLKHYRHIRNKLAHEVGAFDYEQCTKEDVLWLTNFYQMILRREDPLAVVRQIKRQQMEMQQPKVERNTNSTEIIPNKPQQSVKKKSLWQKIVSKIKNFFS